MSDRRRLSLMCTTAEYEAASPEMRQDYDRRLLAKWQANAQGIEARELQADYSEERQHGWAAGE